MTRVAVRAVDLPALLGVPLSPEQLAAATADPAPGLIVAGAGSGKTTVMAARVVWLVGTGQVQTAGVLGLTFTNKAAAELLQRIRSALRRLPAPIAETCDDAIVSTYHSFAGRLLREFGPLIGVEAAAELMSPVRQRQLAVRIASEADIDPDALPGSPLDVAASLLSLDSLIADSNVPVADLIAFDSELIASLRSRESQQRTGERMLATAAARQQLARLVRRYREAKLAQEVLDFADYVRLGATIAVRHPRVGALLRARHQAVLLDEYQDTSVAQRAMLQGLFSGGHPVTAVGDPCQAIYGWRGASPYNIDGFPKHFPRPDGRPAGTFSLATNRRSGANILAVANTVSVGLRRVHADVAELRPDTANGTGSVACAMLPTIADELAWVAQRLRALDRPWGEMAVLARTGELASEAVTSLRAAGIPVSVQGRQSLLALPEVRLIVWALRVAIEPSANDALIGLLMGPRWRIGNRDLALLSRRASELAARGASRAVPGRAQRALGPAAELVANLRGDPFDGPSLLDALRDPGAPAVYSFSTAARNRFRDAAHLVDRWQRMATASAPDLVRSIALDCGLAAELAVGSAAAAPGSPPDDSALAALIELARGFDDLDRGSSAADFLAWLRVADTLPDGPAAPVRPAPDAVTVMTVHAAKGLEFDIVAVPGLVDGVFPSERGPGLWPTTPGALPSPLLSDPQPDGVVGFPSDASYPRAGELAALAAAARGAQRREEERLAYVAVTRARRQLFLSGHYWGRTQVRPRSPSAFLMAAAEAAARGQAQLDTWTLPPDDGAVNPMPGGVGAPATARPATDWQQIATEVVTAAQARSGTATTADHAESHREISADVDEACSLTDGELALAVSWDEDVAALRAEHKVGSEPLRIPAPAELSVSGWLALSADPAGFALDLLRPVPGAVSAAGAAGERFHVWADERDAQLEIWDSDDLIDPAILDPESERQRGWRRALEASPFGPLQPVAVEHSVALRVGAAIVRGRIDAVYVADGCHWVVDWKTGAAGRADPVQLAIYRAAWAAELGIDPAVVVGCFVFVAARRCEVYRQLPDADGLQAIASGGQRALAPDEIVTWEV